MDQQHKHHQQHAPGDRDAHTHSQSHRHGHDHGHGHGHGHDHSHSGLAHSHAPTDGSLKALGASAGLTLIIFLAQVIGGIVSGSLALLSDAMHMLSDSTGLVIAIIAVLFGRRSATARATYGYRRVEVVAALINAFAVIVISVLIVWRAVVRLLADTPPEINTGVMLVVAFVGLAANAIAALILMRRQHESLNIRGAYLHVLSDLLGSIAVIIAGFVIMLTGWTPADVIASLIIAGLVLPRATRLLLDASTTILNVAPRTIDPEVVEQTLAEIPGVKAVHDLHIWSTDGVEPLTTCHLVTGANELDCGGVLDKAQDALTQMGIPHSTIQLETEEHSDHEEHCG